MRIQMRRGTADPVGASALSKENIQTLQNTVLWIGGADPDTDPDPAF
jgi:hypothetical protein